MQPSQLELLATVIFFCAVLHTFFVNVFAKIAQKYPEGSIRENLFHFLAEVEAVFGIWSAVFVIGYAFIEGISAPIKYLESLNFTEPAFVFVIMVIAATRPIVRLAEHMIVLISKLLPLPGRMSFYLSTLIIGPLLGSFITEPAAMTVTAIILLRYFFSKEMSLKFKYATIGVLFVNISIGGTLSHFAAPPVLMVASKWQWGFEFMFQNFGYKGAIACIVNAVGVAFAFRKELFGKFEVLSENEKVVMKPTWWITSIHIFFLALTVFLAHHPIVFLGVFLFFLGFTIVTIEYQDSPKIKESLMVGFFLGGLIVLGTLQKWWIQPVLLGLSDQVLFLGTTFLTAITDNAALTYLGSLVELSESAKYFLLAGAVSGGGLTVIANAPNPAGYGILKGTFKNGAIAPLGILAGAIAPTIVSLICFYFLP